MDKLVEKYRVLAMHTIEYDIPLPGRRVGKYPFDLMMVGDSFLAESQNNVTSAANAYRHRKDWGFRFTTRSLPDGTCRLWRTE